MTDASRMRRAAGWLVLLVCTVTLIAWIGLWAGRREAANQADTIRRAIDIHMLGLRGEAVRYNYLPHAAAGHQDILGVLEAPDDVRKRQLANRYLEDLNRRAGSDTLYVMTLEGRTLAASNWNTPGSFVDHIYANRPYFIDARAGRAGMFYGIGTTTGVPGLFMATPVRRDGVVIGVVAVKVSLREIDTAWAGSRDPIVLADKRGILFIGSITPWMLHTRRTVSPDDLAEINAAQQYGPHTRFALVPWSIERNGDHDWYRVDTTLEGKHRAYIAIDEPWPEMGWTLTVMADHAPVVAAQFTAWALGSLGAGLLLLAGLNGRLHLRRLREQQQARQQLESRVRERTADLMDAHSHRKAMEDALLVGMRARDLDGRITYVNPALCEMTGYSADALIGSSPPYPYWHPDELEKHWQDLEVSLGGNAAVSGFESRIRHRDGHEVFTMIYTAPLIDGTGKHSGWMSSIVDITEKRRSEERQRVQDQQLQHAGRVANLGEMASTLAHELNQPLQAITTHAGNARDYARVIKSEQLDASIKSIEAQAKRCAEIVRRFRDFIKKRTMGVEACDIGEIATTVLALLRPQIKAQQARITTRLQTGLPLVQGDRLLLEQVLLNLILNAVQAMHDMPAQRRLVEIESKHAQGEVQVIISDHGPGIDPESAARLFEPYFTTKPDGLGLGLNICRSIIESHRGHLTFSNRPDGGAVFTIHIPCTP
jgi:two-component system sensor histidine kinase DctS